MALRKLITVGIWTVAVALGINAVRLWRAPVRAEVPPAVMLDPSLVNPRPVNVTPYTLLFEKRADGSRGSESLISVALTAVRSDGSIVRRLDQFGHVVRGSSRLIAFSDGRIVTTDDLARSRTVSQREAIVAARLRDPASNCLKNYLGVPMNQREEVTGKDTFLGYPVLVVTTVESRSFFAPSLGCAQLRYETHMAGGVDVSNIATRVIPGEPLAELFFVSPDYVDIPATHGESR